MYIVFSLVTLAAMVFALIDIITRRDDQAKYLPRMVWLILVILLPFIGSVLWFAIGREYDGQGISLPRRQATSSYNRPPVGAPQEAPADMRTTEQQLADLEREIEEARLREEIARRKRERGEADPG